MALKHLFSPIKLGSMTVKNRLVMPPMSINFGVDEDGKVTEQHWEYLAARAKGGTGLIVVGGGAVHPSGLDLPKMPRVWDDGFIEALSRMTAAVHQYDTRLGMQLLHGGRQAYLSERVAPSALPALGVVKGVPRELQLVEIKELVSSYGDAARRCEQAGFDFVEIHAAHGYLITEFLAPNSNKRSDQYGGSFENRIRFLLEVLENIKVKTGPGFPVGVRINGQDYIRDGWTLQDTERIAPILEKAGADWLHISAGIYGSFPVTIPSMYAEPGCFLHLAEAVKKRVSIPVIAVGRIKNPELADRIIREGRADMVSMGRAHLADPDLAGKAASGRLADIRPCIGCCKGCIESVLALSEATCVMNPALGREYLLKQAKPATRQRRILVIGAGPAGLAVAKRAAIRGHKVMVVEQNGRLGGAARTASLPPGRTEMLDLVHYFERELEKYKVEVRLNTALDGELIAAFKPDAAVLTAGSLPEMPQIEGIFDTGMGLHIPGDVLEGRSTPGERVIILGGNMIGMQMADFFAAKGIEVAVLHRGGHFAEEMAPNDRTYLMGRLKNNSKVRLYKNVVLKEFLADGVRFFSNGTECVEQNASDLIMAEGRRSTRTAADLFKGTVVEVHVIGDAKSPRGLLEAMSEADELGRAL